MTVSTNEYNSLQVELKQAKADLADAQQRISRIETIIWGTNPHSMVKDPNAMINILSDIRDKMPDLEKIRSDYNMVAKVKLLLWGNAGLVAVACSIWGLLKFVLQVL